MIQENGNVERLSKKLSLMAAVSPEILTQIAGMLQYDAKALIQDIHALEKATPWQENLEEAAKWHAKGRESFNRHAFQEAFLCFCKGAENGNAEDMYILGCCFSEGRGTGQSDEEALRWYRKAAEKGNSEAMYSMALCYEQGIGVERNVEEAHAWFAKAAEAGYCPSGTGSYFDHIQESRQIQETVSDADVEETISVSEAEKETKAESKDDPDPMKKKAAKMLEAMGVHISDEDISKLNDAVKENKPFPEMVRDFSSMIYKDNPAMKGAFDSVSDETIASWKDMLENLFKGGPKS